VLPQAIQATATHQPSGVVPALLDGGVAGGATGLFRLADGSTASLWSVVPGKVAYQDVLIGGTGSDLVLGGTGQDVLVGGFAGVQYSPGQASDPAALGAALSADQGNDRVALLDQNVWGDTASLDVLFLEDFAGAAFADPPAASDQA
jgi:hypothetical protein